MRVEVGYIWRSGGGLYMRVEWIYGVEVGWRWVICEWRWVIYESGGGLYMRVQVGYI